MLTCGIENRCFGFDRPAVTVVPPRRVAAVRKLHRFDRARHLEGVVHAAARQVPDLFQRLSDRRR